MTAISTQAYDAAIAAAVKFFKANTCDAAASDLALAEVRAKLLCYAFTWTFDAHADSRDIDDDRPYSDVYPCYPLWCCIMRDPSGVAVSELFSIDLGRDGSPWGNPLRRVIEAEIALLDLPKMRAEVTKNVTQQGACQQG